LTECDELATAEEYSFVVHVVSAIIAASGHIKDQNRRVALIEAVSWRRPRDRDLSR
jgi:hypothetical protein